jgi:hypothetical protein
MKKRTWGLLAGAGAAVAAVVYFVTRGGAGAPEPEPPPPGKANLYGKVKDKDTGKGLGGVLVYLDGMQTLTNEDGDYTLADLDPGDYTLGFAKENYTTISGGVTLEEGNNEINVDLVSTGQTVSFSVKLANIPSYASGAYQWFISYGGNWGMEDPQGGVWTPINEPIAVTGPRTGELHAILMAGPWESWNFYSYQTFENGQNFILDLSEEQPEPPPPPPEEPEEEYTGEIELRHLQISEPGPGVEAEFVINGLACIPGCGGFNGAGSGSQYMFCFYIFPGQYGINYGYSGAYFPANRNTVLPAGCYDFEVGVPWGHILDKWSQAPGPGTYPVLAACIRFAPYFREFDQIWLIVGTPVWVDRNTGLTWTKSY